MCQFKTINLDTSNRNYFAHEWMTLVDISFVTTLYTTSMNNCVRFHNSELLNTNVFRCFVSSLLLTAQT